MVDGGQTQDGHTAQGGSGLKGGAEYLGVGLVLVKSLGIGLVVAKSLGQETGGDHSHQLDTGR